MPFCRICRDHDMYSHISPHFFLSQNGKVQCSTFCAVFSPVFFNRQTKSTRRIQRSRFSFGSRVIVPIRLSYSPTKPLCMALWCRNRWMEVHGPAQYENVVNKHFLVRRRWYKRNAHAANLTFYS